ncbi:MAG: DUF1559 domain-containing protein [Pirellulales bacterium]
MVIAIIGILAALLLPAIQAARESARRAQCLNNVKQIGIALQNYHSTYQTFPPGETALSNGQPGHSWAGRITPYLEENLPIDFNYSGYPDNSPAGFAALPVEHYRALTARIPAYKCPSSAHAPTYNYDGYPEGILPPNPGSVQFALANAFGILEYVGIAGSDAVIEKDTDFVSKLGVLFHDSNIRTQHITDGTSKTLIVGEYSHVTQYQHFNEFESLKDSDTTWDLGKWPGGDYLFSCKTIVFAPFSPAFVTKKGTFNPGAAALITGTASGAALKSGHVSGIHVGMADGSARYLDALIDLVTLKRLADRADGAAVGDY